MTQQLLHAGLGLLDRQIIDKDDELVGKVDDVELSDPEGGEPPRITALLLGPQAYGRRLGGRLGQSIAAIGARLGGTKERIRIPIEYVADFGSSYGPGIPPGPSFRMPRHEPALSFGSSLACFISAEVSAGKAQCG
jgi:sporulation protein YlmC with PRC-barrel domain